MKVLNDSNPDPPHNPSVGPIVEVGDRVGGFEGDDFYQRIWSGGNTVSVQGFQPTTQRPFTTTRRPIENSNDLNSFDMPDEPIEVEIEYPPDVFDSTLSESRLIEKIMQLSHFFLCFQFL